MRTYIRAFVVPIAVSALAACGSGGDGLGPQTTTLKPASLGGIEGTRGGPDALDLGVLRPGTSLVVAHYELATCPTEPSGAQLVIPLHCLDPDPPDPDVRVFVFVGDGSVSLDEWTKGVHLTELAGLPGEYPVATVDVTAELGNCIAAADPHLSFRPEYTGDDLDLAGSGGGRGAVRRRLALAREAVSTRSAEAAPSECAAAIRDEGRVRAPKGKAPSIRCRRVGEACALPEGVLHDDVCEVHRSCAGAARRARAQRLRVRRQRLLGHRGAASG